MLATETFSLRAPAGCLAGQTTRDGQRCLPFETECTPRETFLMIEQHRERSLGIALADSLMGLRQ